MDIKLGEKYKISGEGDDYVYQEYTVEVIEDNNELSLKVIDVVSNACLGCIYSIDFMKFLQDNFIVEEIWF